MAVPRYLVPTINNIEKTIIVFLYVLISCAIIYRSFFGIEITDEALYVAEGHIVTQGARLFIDMWSLAPGFALMNAPFVWIYVFLTGSTSGIMLYFRITSLVIRLSIVVLVCLIMKPYMKTKITALWLLPFFAFLPYSIITMSYNTWSLTLFLLACISLTRAVLSDERKMLFGILAGSFTALTILCYPPMIIIGIALIGLLFIYERFNHIGHHTLCGYIIGGLIMSLIVILLFSLRSSDINEIFEGLKIMISYTPNHNLFKNIMNDLFNLIIIYAKNWVFLIFISYTFLYLPILNKKYKAKIIIACIVFSIFYYTINIYSSYSQLIYSNSAGITISNIIFRLFYPIPLILFPIIDQNKKSAFALLLFLYLPSLLYCSLGSIFALNGMNNRYYFLMQGTFLTIPFLFWAISNLAQQKLNSKLSFFCPFLVSFILTLGFLLNYYGYIYREEPIAKLDYKIDYGVYSGLKTTKAKGEGIVALEKILRSETSSFNNILFMDCVPMAYLMTDALHCAPSTWDIQQYSYGFTDDTLLRKYFERTGCTPDKIIYIFTGRDKILSIDSEDYKFNNYVNANYKLTSDIDAYYPVKIYERIAK